MAIYRIKDWNTRYENNRTRGYKHLDWVPMPNKMDGDGYTELVELSKGEKEYYGALRFAGWCAIVEIASRCNPRGTLCRDSAGVCGHTAESLSRISRLPKLVFDLVFDRALKVGWIEDISKEINHLHDIAGILQNTALNRIEENRIEEKGKERNEIEEKTKLSLFRNTEFVDITAFTGEFPEWAIEKIEYYHQSLLDWSDGITSKGGKQQKKTDWIRTAQVWERKDKENGTGFYGQKLNKVGALGISLDEMSNHGQQTYKNAVEALGIKK